MAAGARGAGRRGNAGRGTATGGRAQPAPWPSRDHPVAILLLHPPEPQRGFSPRPGSQLGFLSVVPASDALLRGFPAEISHYFLIKKSLRFVILIFL